MVILKKIKLVLTDRGAVFKSTMQEEGQFRRLHWKGETAEVNCVLFAQIAGFAFKKCKTVRAHVLEGYPKSTLVF